MRKNEREREQERSDDDDDDVIESTVKDEPKLNEFKNDIKFEAGEPVKKKQNK